MNDENKKNSQNSQDLEHEKDVVEMTDATADSVAETDDVVYEASPDLEAGDDLSEDITSALSKIKELKAKLAQSQKENQENLAGWQRAKADLINANRRHQEEKARFIAMAEEAVIEQFLPVADSFDMAMANKTAWESIDQNWRIGVENIYNQVVSALKSFNVSTINPIDQKFDPREHNSVEIVPAESKEQDDLVVGVIQKGYKKGENVLRPATVKVAHFNNEAENKSQ